MKPRGIAYRMRLHDLLSPDFGTQVGHKIGCTSAVMQQYLGIPHPAPADSI
jgi:2-keto-4-pentenoate hydratase